MEAKKLMHDSKKVVGESNDEGHEENPPHGGNGESAEDAKVPRASVFTRPGAAERKYYRQMKPKSKPGRRLAEYRKSLTEGI